MKPRIPQLLLLVFLLAIPSVGRAHFGMLIPDKASVGQQDKTVNMELSFSHPFEMIGMDLVKPEAFDVYVGGAKSNLLDTLEQTKVMDHNAWKSAFKVKRPGVYHFAMTPTPYWEPAEDVSIIHYTKCIVPAFGAEDGWAEELGLKTEIIPLARPFGAYAGYTFTGQVKLDGKVVPYAEVEVEYYNQEKKFTAPTETHVTHVVRADQNGVFTFSCPQAGWWGFAALNEADYTLPDPSGAAKGVELGAVLWVYMSPWR